MARQALFHPRTLSKALSNSSPLKDGQIPTKHKKLLQGWVDSINDGSLQKKTEKELHSIFCSQLCEGILGYKTFTAKNKKGEWTLSNEKAVKKIGHVDIGLGYFSDTQNSRLLVPLELKSPKTTNMDIPMLGRELSTVEQAERYARNSQGQSQWFIVSNCTEIRLYKYPYSDVAYQSWQVAELLELQNYAEFVLLLSEKNLLGGNTAKWLEASEQVEKDITDSLYTDYRDVRIKLINGMKRENNRFRRASMVKRAQTLLDRVLFAAFAEDRGLLPDRTLHSYISKANEFMSAWDMLKLLFKHIDQGHLETGIPKYNGDLFKPDPELEELTISDDLISELRCLWEYDFDTDVSVTILGHIFEQSIADLDQIYDAINEDNDLVLADKKQGTSGKRKQDGVVYTPDFITRWIVEQTLGGYLEKRKKEVAHPQESAQWWQAYRDILATTRICDPACGSGAFLVAAFHFLKAEYALLNERLQQFDLKQDLFGSDLSTDILNNNLFGVDLNPESVEIARLSLWLVTAEKGKPLTSLKENIRQGNSIVSDKSLDKGAFNWHGRFKEFDVILGNPPYVRQERLSSIKPYLQDNYQTYHGVADLYTYFFELGVNLLKKGGYMGFISSSTFFKTGSGQPLREFLKVQTNLKTLVNFGDLQVFAGVTTYPAILVMEKPARSRKQAPKDQKVQFINIVSDQLSQLPQELETPVIGEMQQSHLAEEGWRLEDESLQALRQKITKGKKTLKEVYGQPLYGLKTGLNAAFVIDKTTRDQMVQQDPQSLDRLKPFLEGKDLKKWRAESRELYLILFPKGWTRTAMGYEPDSELTEETAWQWLNEQHPTICQWLEPFQAQGRKRGDKGEFWWELRACAYYDKFETAKVVYVDIGNQSTFSLDTQSRYCANTAYFIGKGDFFITALLNSPLIWFLIAGMANAVRGGYYRLFTQHMETLPIPASTNEQRKQLSELAETCQKLAEQRYQKQARFSRRLLELCPADKDAKLSQKMQAWWQLDFATLKAEIKSRFKHTLPLTDAGEWEEYFQAEKEQVQQLSFQLAQQEKLLNTLVYQLFELAPDEISLLEAALK